MDGRVCCFRERWRHDRVHAGHPAPSYYTSSQESLLCFALKSFENWANGKGEQLIDNFLLKSSCFYSAMWSTKLLMRVTFFQLAILSCFLHLRSPFSYVWCVCHSQWERVELCDWNTANSFAIDFASPLLENIRVLKRSHWELQPPSPLALCNLLIKHPILGFCSGLKQGLTWKYFVKG